MSYDNQLAVTIQIKTQNVKCSVRSSQGVAIPLHRSNSLYLTDLQQYGRETFQILLQNVLLSHDNDLQWHGNTQKETWIFLPFTMKILTATVN